MAGVLFCCVRVPKLAEKKRRLEQIIRKKCDLSRTSRSAVTKGVIAAFFAGRIYTVSATN